MNRKNFNTLLAAFLTWRFALLIFLFLAISVVPLQKDFLGGGISNYLSKPYLWSWVNFDGEHYLAVARNGYQALTYFYFPTYPLISRLVSNLLGGSFVGFAISGLLVSNISIFLAMIGFWKLVNLDYERKVAFFGVLLLLVFPTSFFLGGYYTESMFLALVVWSFYLAREGKWFYAGILGLIATATRVVGIALLPALLAEFYIVRRPLKTRSLKVISLLLIPLGLIAYMYYLKTQTGDPLEFLHSASIFGQQRSTSLIILPQVFYRYFFKILPNLDYSYFPIVFSTMLEIITALILFGLSILAFSKLRLSYAVYLVLGYIIPTLSGSFSSLPRYALVLFPAFLLASVYLVKAPKVLRVVVIALLLISLGVSTSYFVRGFWIS